MFIGDAVHGTQSQLGLLTSERALVLLTILNLNASLFDDKKIAVT